MDYPKFVTKYVKATFNYFGFEIYRTLKIKKEIKQIHIGSYPLFIDSTNPLYTTYLSIPDYASELGRLVFSIKQFNKGNSISVIDIGANIGDTLAIIKTADKDATVYCIEGDEYCFGFLKKNSRQFNYVNLYQLYLAEFTESISVNLDKKGWNTTIIPTNNEESQIIHLMKLDEFLHNENMVNEKINLIKVDTEGFDLRILRGAIQFLTKVKPILYIEYNRSNMSEIGEKGFPTLLKLANIGYESVFVYENTGRFILSVSLKHEIHLIEQLHEYIDGIHSSIVYFDLCIFHEQDNELASSFLKTERQFRNSYNKHSVRNNLKN